VRVLIADDSALVREGLGRLLQDAGFDVVALAHDLVSAETAAEFHRPDIAILDIRMPPTFTDEGVQLAARLKGARPELGVLLLSQDIESRTAVRLAQEHPRGFGYLLKDRVLDISRFFDDVRRVAGGATVMDPEVVGRLLGRQTRREVLASLSARERDVLTLLASGRSNAAIAAELYLNTKTVEAHIASIFTKLGLRPDRAENRRVLAVLAFLGA
jgi:DNA-binding NarL/FixJ family response regulator